MGPEFTESVVGEGDEKHLAMAPSSLQGFIAHVREIYDRLAGDGEIPCILTNPSIRPFVRSIIERVRPATVVLSQNEIHPVCVCGRSVRSVDAPNGAIRAYNIGETLCLEPL